MKVHRIAVLDAERMTRAKTALLTLMTRQDRYRIGDTWHNAAERWGNGENVDEVNHYGRHQMAAGDVLIVERIDGKPIMHVQIDGIRMMHTDALTQADIAALGYDNREMFAAEWQDVFGGKVWWYEMRRIDARSVYKAQ